MSSEVRRKLDEPTRHIIIDLLRQLEGIKRKLKDLLDQA